jgi:tetratricopeptide (TPR) repeat protein
MSIINQMLRDLDARGVTAVDVSAASHHVPLKARRSSMRTAVLALLLLSAAGGTAYLLWSGTMHGSRVPVTAVAARREAVSVPVKAASPVQDDPQPAPMAPPAAPAPAAPKLPAVMAGKVAQKPVVPQSDMQRAPAVSVLAEAEPAVVKKMSELTPEGEAQQYFDEAQLLRRAGKTDAAIVKYRLALDRNPGMRRARLQLARLLQESGQAEAASSLLKAGYDRQPDPDLAIAIGRLMADQGRRDDALTWLARGRENLRPADQALMGALLSQASRYAEAVQAYQLALAADPGQGGWSLGLGLALESLGRVSEAKEAYRNALDRGTFKPEVVKYLRNKIEAYGL